MSAAQPLVTLEAATKAYGPRVLLGWVSLGVAAGDRIGVVGHNGAGKTTLLNQVAGLARPTSGSIRIDGHDPVADPAAARRLCSLQPQSQAPLEGLTPRQALDFVFELRQIDADESESGKH